MNKILFQQYCNIIYDIGWYEALLDKKTYKGFMEKNDLESGYMDAIRRHNELEKQIKLELE